MEYVRSKRLRKSIYIQPTHTYLFLQFIVFTISWPQAIVFPPHSCHMKGVGERGGVRGGVDGRAEGRVDGAGVERSRIQNMYIMYCS